MSGSPSPVKITLNVKNTVASWLLTVDHKRIAILYLISITFFFGVGGIAAALIRLALTTPHDTWFQSETYNKLFTIHGVLMIFFFLIPSIPAVLGNFLIPLMVGARDLAFPRLNLFSWYLYTVAGMLAVAAMVLGGVDTGWTFYTPYSSHVQQLQRRADDLRRVHRRVLVYCDGHQLHRDDPQDARSRPDVVPAAALLLVHVRHEHRADSGNARRRDHAAAGGCGAHAASGHLRPG